MLKFNQVEYQGYECIKLESDVITLYVTVSVGPRILGCRYRGGPNLFAVVGEDEVFAYPGGGSYYVRGGHRLWYAPETARITYVPDNQPVEFQENLDGISLCQAVDAPTGIQKSMQIMLDSETSFVGVKHVLTNTEKETVELAPWAITQMQPGGVGILPQNTRLADEEGFWANRSLALWPYAQMQDPHITWGDQFIFVQAAYTTGRFKVGFPNPCGWMAYAIRDRLFVKSAMYHPQADYYDYQSSSQCYCNPLFLELETLGPRTVLAAGESTTHIESWSIYGGIDFAADQHQMSALAEQLALDG